jgi:1,4-dihydroxy-2-naphthoate octaprenyltransferase
MNSSPITRQHSNTCSFKGKLGMIQKQNPKSALSDSFVPLFIHLRLHFQLLLSPVFLWGFLLGEGQLNIGFWIAFVAFHIFLYGGTTAFNSYYDRDQGPVGGLEKPPPVTSELLPFSLVVQIVGALLAAFVNTTFFSVYIIMFIVFTAYSHPRIRLKGRPLVGLLSIALCQGVLAGLGGAAVADATLNVLTPLKWVSLFLGTGLIVGFYPITQIYQVDEDLARGDLTFAAWAGIRGTFAFTLITMSLASLTLIPVFHSLFNSMFTFALAVFCVFLLTSIAHWGRTYNPAETIHNYRYIMRLYRLMSLGFLAFACLRLLHFL